MAKRKLEDKLIKKELITEELKLIDGSDSDYITPQGKVYKDYGNGNMLLKKNTVNKVNGYLYVGITMKNGKNKSHRVHILVAKAFLPNPNNLPCVCHIDNNKQNPKVSNLKWGTVAENTQQAFDDKLIINDKGYDDNQSIPIYYFDLDKNMLGDFGSVSEAAKALNITKSGILYQCKHKLKTKPRKGFYFRYQFEYNERGFVL